MRILFVFLGISLLFGACEKDISVSIPLPVDGIVVEGYIESGKAPYVILTKNSPYFQEVDLNSLQNLLIFDAFVTVSDGLITDTLQFGINPDQFPYAYYTGSKIIGQEGKSYELRIIRGKDSLYAQTSIPMAVPIDSLVFKGEPDFADTLGYVWLYFSDPAAKTNYYRQMNMVLGVDSFFVHPFSSILDDKILNGQLFQLPTYHGFTGTQGAAQDTSEMENDDFSFYFKEGDKVVIKLSSIDVETYLFWKTLEAQAKSGGNPFATPANVFSNIKGGGIGIWGGYGVWLDTLEIRHPDPAKRK
jgi:hypothetical protein